MSAFPTKLKNSMRTCLSFLFLCLYYFTTDPLALCNYLSSSSQSNAKTVRDALQVYHAFAGAYSLTAWHLLSAQYAE